MCIYIFVCVCICVRAGRWMDACMARWMHAAYMLVCMSVCMHVCRHACVGEEFTFNLHISLLLEDH